MPEDNIFNSNTDDVTARWAKAYDSVSGIVDEGNRKIIDSMIESSRLIGSILETQTFKFSTEIDTRLRIVLDFYRSVEDLEKHYNQDFLNNAQARIEAIKREAADATEEDRKAYQEKVSRLEDEVSKFKNAQEDRRTENRRTIDQMLSDERESASEKSRILDTFSTVNKGVRKGADYSESIMGALSGPGGQGQAMSEVAGMGADFIGGMGLLMSPNYGQGIANLSQLIVKALGIAVRESVEEAARRRSVLDILSAGEVGPAPFSGAALDAMTQLSTSKYPGVPEFTQQRIMSGIQQMEQSRQFGGSKDPDQRMQEMTGRYHDYAIMGMSQGLSPEETISTFIDMMQRLKIPTEDLEGVFGQLASLSKELDRPLRDLIRDFGNLHQSNLIYGYSREEEMYMLTRFNDELKNHILSIQDIVQYMKGLAGMDLTQATGTFALLSNAPADQMKQFYKGNDKDFENLQKVFSAFKGSDLEGGDVLQLLLNPKAQGPFDDVLRQKIQQKTGLGGEDILHMNEALSQMIKAYSMDFATQNGETDLGAAQLKLTAMMKTLGLNVPQDRTKQGYLAQGIDALGNETNVDPSRARSYMESEMSKYEAVLKETIPTTVKLGQSFEQLEQRLTRAYHDLTKTGDMGQFEKTLMPIFQDFQKQFGDNFKEVFGPDMMKMAVREGVVLGMESFFGMNRGTAGTVWDIGSLLNPGITGERIGKLLFGNNEKAQGDSGSKQRELEVLKQGILKAKSR